MTSKTHTHTDEIFGVIYRTHTQIQNKKEASHQSASDKRGGSILKQISGEGSNNMHHDVLGRANLSLLCIPFTQKIYRTRPEAKQMHVPFDFLGTIKIVEIKKKIHKTTLRPPPQFLLKRQNIYWVKI